MRIHTTAVPATKYLPERIHCKLTDNNDAPNNIKDFTYQVNDFKDEEHDYCAGKFLSNVLGLQNAYTNKIGYTLTKRGYVYEIVES